VPLLFTWMMVVTFGSCDGSLATGRDFSVDRQYSVDVCEVAAHTPSLVADVGHRNPGGNPEEFGMLSGAEPAGSGNDLEFLPMGRIAMGWMKPCCRILSAAGSWSLDSSKISFETKLDVRVCGILWS
jgi:hypothetical protein